MKTLIKSILIMLLLTVGASQSFAEQKVTFYHYDLLGSPVATTDENGDVIWREEYGPWGEKLLKEDEALDNVRGYTGHVNDKETGLTYMQARYYDPQIGRFMGVDPVGFKEENPILFNRYAYANNNPYKFTDPNGEEPGSEDGDDTYNDTLASHTFGVEGISDFDRKAISYGNVRQASVEAQRFMRNVPDSRYSKEMNQLGSAAVVFASIATKGKKGSLTHSKKSLLPDSAWHKNAPHQITPGTASISHQKYNPKTRSIETSTVNYDQYGRQVKRTDYTTHGYSDKTRPNEYHSNPHTHNYEYGPGFSPKGKETRINHE